MQPQPAFERALIVSNPNAGRAKQASVKLFELIDQCHTSGTETSRVETRDFGLLENIQYIAENIREGDLVIAAGGDGTAHIVLNALYMASQPRTSLLCMSFGGGNDAGREMAWSGDGVDTLTKTRQKQPIRPLEVTVGDQAAWYALCNVGVGASAQTSQAVNRASYRRLRRTAEGGGDVLRAGLDGLVIGATLLCSAGVRYTRDNVTNTARELSYSNGSSMAGMVRTGGSLAEPGMMRVEIPQGPIAAAGIVRGVMAAHFARTSISANPLIMRDVFGLPDGGAIHGDGEVRTCSPDSLVSIAVAEQSVMAWMPRSSSLPAVETGI